MYQVDEAFGIKVEAIVGSLWLGIGVFDAATGVTSNHSIMHALCESISAIAQTRAIQCKEL
jgi:uncharacterized membrane protein